MDLVEVVMPVPFQTVAGYADLLVQLVDKLRNAARQFDARITDSNPMVSQSRIFTDCSSGTCSLMHQAFGKGEHEPFDICAGDVLEMAARRTPASKAASTTEQ